jgi:hypothetical protein
VRKTIQQILTNLPGSCGEAPAGKCRIWVKLGPSALSAQCPVCLRKRSNDGHSSRSESCRNRTLGLSLRSFVPLRRDGFRARPAGGTRCAYRWDMSSPLSCYRTRRTTTRPRIVSRSDGVRSGHELSLDAHPHSSRCPPKGNLIAGMSALRCQKATVEQRSVGESRTRSEKVEPTLIACMSYKQDAAPAVHLCRRPQARRFDKAVLLARPNRRQRVVLNKINLA